LNKGAGALLADRRPDYYLAGAVIPPPRLRAKWVFFSALLHLAEDGKDWAAGEGIVGRKKPANPCGGAGKKREIATVGLGCSVPIDQASMDFLEGCRKKVME